jgi:hypothetical protein
LCGEDCLHSSAPAHADTPRKPNNNPNPHMKNIILTLIACAGFTLTAAFAESKSKEITLSGKACCAKCCLKTATECETVLTVEKDGKKTNYYLAKNDVSEKFHGEICKGPKAASVTATCKKEGDKLVLTCSKAEVMK